MSGEHVETLLVPARVDGRVLVRPSRGAPAGLVVGFHGYAESAAIHLERLLALDRAGRWTVASVQALNRFYRGRTETTVAGWMTREDRDAAIANNVAYVDAVIDRVMADAPRLVCIGFSQGVAMAFRSAVRGARRAQAVVAVGGDVPPELLRDASLAFPPVLLVRGERDEWYTQPRLDADAAALAARGTDLTTAVLDGGHDWSASATAAAAAFLDRAAAR